MKLKIAMKNILILTALGFALSSCTKNSEILPRPNGQVGVDGNNPPITEPEEGGISAGGGGTLPADPISVYEVMKTMEFAKPILRMVFNDFRYFSGMGLTRDKYFYGEKNLATQLEITDIEILQDKPCKDKFGRDVDASIHASRPNMICLSASRVAPKLIEEVAAKEIYALLAHELAHFLGANEKEAVEIQGYVAHWLREFSIDKAAETVDRLWMTPMEIESISSIKSSIRNDVEKSNLAGLRESFMSIYSTISKIEERIQSEYLGFIDYEERDYQELILGRLRLAMWYVESLDSDYSYQETSKFHYENCFKDRVEFSAGEIGENCPIYVDKDNLYMFYKFQKLNSLQDLTNDLKDVFVYAHDLGAQIRAIVFDQPLPYFNLPQQTQTIHPWLQFVGSYKIVDKKCFSNSHNNYNRFDGLESIEIQPTIINYPVENQQAVLMTEKTSNSTHGYNIGNGVGQNSMRVSGSDSAASVEESRGTRWYDRQNHGWMKTSKSIRKSGNQLILEMKYEYFRYGHRGFEEEGHHCEFTLQ